MLNQERINLMQWVPSMYFFRQFNHVPGKLNENNNNKFPNDNKKLNYMNNNDYDSTSRANLAL